MSSSRPRIMFFDMEGTLLCKEHSLDDGSVPPSAWTVLAAMLGPECLAAENQTKIDWLAGKYAGYLDWMRATVEIHRSFRLTEAAFCSLIDSVPFTPNAAESLERIHAWGTVTVLITGGFKALADKVQRGLRIHHALAGCEYFFDAKSGQIEHVNLLPADNEGKVDFMRLICREYKISASECAFVGDGKNDVHLAREVGFSVAFNAQPELREVASVSISQPQGKEDFMAVAELVERQFSKRRQT